MAPHDNTQIRNRTDSPLTEARTSDSIASIRSTAAQSKIIQFSKMHGAGNDFVVFDGRYGIPFNPTLLAPLICDRQFGIGADGIIALGVSDKADFRMNYFNADGSSAICGNGIRCLVKFIVGHGLHEGRKQLEIETDTSVVAVEILGKGEWLRVDMGAPLFEGLQIPVAEAGKHLRREITVAGTKVRICAVGMGNPHCVVFVDDLEQVPFATLGPALETDPFFPQKTNVEFVQALSLSSAKVRVWERGVGETLACGTGACAVIAAGAATGKTGRSVQLQFKGGQFFGTWSEETNRIVLTGPAEEVFRGSLDIERLITAETDRKSGAIPGFICSALSSIEK